MYVCQSVSFFVHGHSFERIWANLTYMAFLILSGHGHGPVSERHLRPQARAPRAMIIYAAANGWRVPSGNSELPGGRLKGPSAASARSNRAP